jgi:hypothetical protein
MKLMFSSKMAHESCCRFFLSELLSSTCSNHLNVIALFFRNARGSTPFFIDRGRTEYKLRTYNTSDQGQKDKETPHKNPTSFHLSASSTIASTRRGSDLDLFLKILLFSSIQIDLRTNMKRQRTWGFSLVGQDSSTCGHHSKKPSTLVGRRGCGPSPSGLRTKWFGRKDTREEDG